MTGNLTDGNAMDLTSRSDIQVSSSGSSIVVSKPIVSAGALSGTADVIAQLITFGTTISNVLTFTVLNSPVYVTDLTVDTFADGL